MSLDFALTQFYRLVVDDLILMYDAYLFYSRFKRDKRTLKEFSDVLANLIEVEAQNFEDIDETKLSQDSEERVEFMIRDYFMSVVVRYILDDLSQFPFWSAKQVILNQEKQFGTPLIKEFWSYLKIRFTTRQIKSLYEGVGPYLCASFIINFDYISRSTNNFIIAMLSRIPQPPPNSSNSSTALSATSSISKISAPAIKALKNSVSSPGRKYKDASKGSGFSINWVDFCKKLAIETLSHPFLVMAVSMVTDPFIKGDTWPIAYVKFVKKYGIPAFYNGLRTRIVFTLLPLSPFLLMGITDTIAYRKMCDHRDGITENLLTMAREFANSSDKPGNRFGIFNYGLLTALHILPGFASFVGMRLLAWLTFGSSNHRKHQIMRRKEIVEAHVLKIKKRNSSSKLLAKSLPSNDLKKLTVGN